MNWTAVVRFPAQVRDLSLLNYIESVQLPVQWVRGALSKEVKRQEREADRSPPFKVEVKNGGVNLEFPPYVLMML
jgi:hypothetical protein